MHECVVLFILGEDDQFIRDLRATRHSCTISKEILINIAVPTIDSSHYEGLNQEVNQLVCSGKDYHEWLGAVSCGVDV